MMRVIEAWRRAGEDASEPWSDITEAEHGDYLAGPYMKHGWSVTRQDWGLGVSVDWERWQGRLRVSFQVELGPFAWTLDWMPDGDLAAKRWAGWSPVAQFDPAQFDPEGLREALRRAWRRV